MSILTFGGGNNAVDDTVRQQPEGEELRDERLNQQLMDAYNKKQAGQFFEALQSYTAVLEDTFLKDAKIDKHVFMRFNAHKNCGEVYEKIEKFPLAKYHYTQALKIQQRDSFIWTRLGYIEFERFKDLKMAQACFDAAAKTLSTLEKRSAKICPILVKLAEINFLLYDFKTSEVMVDTLISRQLPEQNSLLFGYLMKSYFCTLKNENILANSCLQRAQQLQNGAKVDELQVVKTMRKQRFIIDREPIMYSQSDQEYVSLGSNSAQYKAHMRLVVDTNDEPSTKSLKSFPELFAHFIRNLGSNLEMSINQIGAKKSQNLVLDCSNYLDILIRNKDQMTANWEENFQQNQILKSQSSLVEEPIEVQLTKAAKEQNQNMNATKAKNGGNIEARRGKKRPDNDELMKRKFDLDAFDQFKQGILFREDFQEITSQAQIKAIQTLFQKRTNSNLVAASINKQQQDEESKFQLSNSLKINRVVPPISLLGQFENVLRHVQDKNVFYVARNLLRFVIDGEAKGMLRDTLAFDYFRLYMLVIQASGPCSKAMSGLYQLDQFGSYNVVLTMFELALFNKDVIKRAKSGPVMSHRQSIFSYLCQFVDLQQQQKETQTRETYADYKLKEQLENIFKGDSKAQINAFREYKVRLLYAMMFYSFEIQNDMTQSVVIYQKLEVCNSVNIGPINQPWLSEGYTLDHQKITTFGNCKIQEAQKVRDLDQAISALKQAEVQQMKRRIQPTNTQDSSKYRPECITYAKFYLEQLFNYLILALQNDQQTGSTTTSFNATFTSNEEKIKEMWEKLCYSLSRSETKEMLAIVQYIFCTLAAFQILNKTYYDSFILRRLDFEKLFDSISDRFKTIYAEVKKLKKVQPESRITRTQLIRNKIQDILQRPDIDQFLIKMEVHMLRLFTPEFLHTNIRLQHGEQDNQLLSVYYKILFSIEMIKGGLFEEEKGYKAYENACNLMMSLDILAQQNQEMMNRPYLRLVQFAFPSLLKLFTDQAQIVQASQTSLKALLQSSLGSFIQTGLNFFLSFKVNFEDMLPTVDQGRESSARNEEMFAHLTTQIGTPNQSGGISGQREFQQMLLRNSKPDMIFLADLVKCLDFCLEGRLLNHAALTVSDIEQTIKITENLGNLVFAHRNWLQERCPSSKERCVAIKNTFRDVNLHNGDDSSLKRVSSSCLCVQLQRTNQSCYEADFPESLSLIIFFLLNYFSQVGLPASAAILPNIQLGQRAQFLEKLSSLHDLKKLRALSYIDLQYSENLEVTSLMMSYVFLQYYQTSNEAKVQKDYAESSEYKDMRQFHKQASNCVIAALNFVLKSRISGQQQLSQREIWKNVSTSQFLKLAMEQLLQVQLTRIKGKEHVKYFQESLKMQNLASFLTPFVYLPGTEKGISAIKLRLLRGEASLYAYICSQLDTLSCSILQSTDPRAKQLPRQKFAQTAEKIIQIFLESVYDTQVEVQQQSSLDKPSPHAKMKQVLLSDKQTHICRSKLNQLMSDNEVQYNLKLVPLANLNYDYCYFQAVLQQEDEHQVNQDSIHLYIKALEIALAANESGGVFQIMLKLIEISLLIASQLKYNTGSGMSQETRTHYQQILDTVSKQVLYEPKLKTMMDQFLALTMQRVFDNQDRINQFMANRGPNAVLEFQFDQESIIYDRFASRAIRSRLFKKQSMSEMNQLERILMKLYETGDKLVYMLTKSFQRTPFGQQTSTSQNSAQDAKGKNKHYQEFQKEWLKVELNQVMAKSLFFEFQANIEMKAQQLIQNGSNPRMEQWQEGWTLVREMQQQINKDLLNINEILSIHIQNFQQQWNSDCTLCPMGVIKSSSVSGKHLLNLQMVQTALNQFFSVDSETKIMSDGLSLKRLDKSLVGFTNFNVFTAGVLRAKVKLLLLMICEKSQDYEPARDIFKATMTKVKQNLGASNECRYNEMQQVFDLSKQTYLKLITEHADQICRQFATVQYELRNNTSNSMHPKLYHSYNEIRQKYHTSSEIIPPILRDIFEIFIEGHNSKMFLRKFELLTADQQLTLRQSVLKVCAVCGPDSEQHGGGAGQRQITTKFINLQKITDIDYLYEGLRICISWFEKVLEGSATSHHLGTNQAITGKLTSRGSKNASDLRRKLLETFDEIERVASLAVNVQPVGGGAVDQPQQLSTQAQAAATTTTTGRSGPQTTTGKQSKEAAQAQQVFKMGSYGISGRKQ